jgi:hypothetical protein
MLEAAGNFRRNHAIDARHNQQRRAQYQEAYNLVSSAAASRRSVRKKSVDWSLRSRM